MKKLSHSEFENRIKQILPNIEILETYTNKRTRIKVHCKNCGNIWSPIADSLLRGHGCGVCSKDGKAAKSKPIIISGYNDLFTTLPEYAKYLKNKKDAYRYTFQSSKKIYWICPNCHSDILSSVAQVYQVGLKCPYCSDGVSYPNKFIYHFLNQLNIKFTREYKIENLRYDVKIDNTNYIIEMDGGFHFMDNSMTGETVSDIHNKDMKKTELAEKYGFKVIRIDARISTCEYIKKSILESELIDLLNISLNIQNIDWDDIDKKSQHSIFYNVIQLYNSGLTSYKDISQKLNIKLHRSTIYHYIKRGNQLGLCKLKSNKKKVRCIQDNLIFESIKEAQDFYHFSGNKGICSSCKRGTSCYITRNNRREKINFEYVE